MIFDGVEPRYRGAIVEAAETILEKGNKQQRNVARYAIESELVIRFVPLEKIKVSGITGLVDSRATNRRIRDEKLTVEEAMGEVHITFSDWCVDEVGQRACQGTLVHEGLHAYDFARMISVYSKNGKEENPYDLTLYELERRAALISADYLARIGTPDFVKDGLDLDLVFLDKDGNPQIDREGILRRLKNSYGLDDDDQGRKISSILGVNPNGTSRIRRWLGIG